MSASDLERYKTAELQSARATAITRALGFEVRLDWDDDRCRIAVVPYRSEQAHALQPIRSPRICPSERFRNFRKDS